jgi:hypothetical protein
MKVEDLKSLSSKIVAHAQQQKTEHYFEQFFDLLQQNIRKERQQQPVSQQKDQLFKSMRSFDQMPLTYSEKNLFEVLSYDTIVGSKAVAAIDGILHDMQFDQAGVVQNIKNKLNEFKQFIEINKTLQSALQRVPTLKETALHTGEALLEITFTDKAAVENIVDFEEWIDCWTKIIRAFSRLVREKPESSRIIFVQKSSPLIIDVAAACGLVLALGKAVDSVLNSVEKYLRIRMLVEDIRKIKLENNKAEKALMDEAEAFSEKLSQEIARDLTAGVKPKASGEIVNGVSLAVKSLFGFVDKGGRVDCPSATDDKQADDIQDIFKKVRELQQSVDRLRLLPAPCDETDDDSNK